MNSSPLSSLRTPYKLDRLVIAPSGRDGEFDSLKVDCPFPFRHENRFGTIYVGWDGTGYRTGLAWSDDLVHWEKEGMILDRGPKGSTTEFNVALTGVLRDNDLTGSGELKRVNGRFVGAYHAYPGAGYEAGSAVIGMAYSDDLRHWELTEPVLRPEDGAAWECGGLYKSWLTEHDGVYYMFYNAKERDEWPWIEQTGFATSTDLVHWKRFEGNPVLKVGEKGAFDDVFASDPVVLRNGDEWVMFYFGNSSDGHARDSFATSNDLVHWEKSGDILVDVGPEGSVDSLHAHKPGIIYWNDRLYHFYCAVRPRDSKEGFSLISNEIRGIALAVSKPI